jgi:hypothetical protein
LTRDPPPTYSDDVSLSSRRRSISVVFSLLTAFASLAQIRGAAAAEPERTLLGSYFLNEVFYKDGVHERVHFDAVVTVPDVEGATYYLLEARAGGRADLRGRASPLSAAAAPE